jgi:protein disulfide-isomerase
VGRKLIAATCLVGTLALGACGSTSPPRASGSGRTATTTSPATGPYEAGRDARSDITAALAASQADGKLVIIDFGANWCPDCRVLDKLYHDPTVSPTLEAKFRVVPVDVGEFDTNMDVSADYANVAKAGIPALVVLNPDGSVKADTRRGEFANARTMTAAELLGHLQQFTA